jgi:hypothetical protein
MSFDAVSGISGSSLAPLVPAPAGISPSAATQGSAGATPEPQASDRRPIVAPAKPAQPLLLVPTTPMTPSVLAQLAGQQWDRPGLG